MRPTRHLLALGVVVVGMGCSAEARPASVSDASAPDASAPDASAPRGEDASAPFVCEDGFEPDALGRCGRWTTLSGAPACFDVAMATMRGASVLVLGNCHDPDAHPPILLSAFVFSPDTQTWRLLPDAAPTRIRSTVTLLPDGRVLIVGGASFGPSSVISPSTVLFDPDGETFSPASDMTTPRASHTATLLADGRVLVAGGHTSALPGEPTASVEIFDPSNGTWHAAAPMHTARAGHTASLLDNGRIAVIGGVDASRAITSSVEIYDPFRDAWHDGPWIETISGNQTATPLSDGSLLVVDAHDVLRSFAGLTGFVPAAEMHAAREGHFAIALSTGMVLVVGGVTSGGDERPPAELYDPSADTWSETHTPGVSIWSGGGDVASATQVGSEILLHSDNVGFLVYEWPMPRCG